MAIQAIGEDIKGVQEDDDIVVVDGLGPGCGPRADKTSPGAMETSWRYDGDMMGI